MKMPFGKYKGIDVENCPFEYLYWLTENVDLRGALREAVYSVVDEDTTNYADSTSGYVLAVAPNEIATVRQIIDAGYRSVAGRIHPDVGGSTAEMQRLNAVAASLRSQLSILAPRQEGR